MKQPQEIDRLKEENERLKDRWRYQKHSVKEGFFGASTPSSKRPVKPNATVAPQPKMGGAKPGHAGQGRPAVPLAPADRGERVNLPERCPDCGGTVEGKGTKARSVIEVEPLRRQTVHYQLERKYCPGCRRWVTARAPGVLKRALLSNRLLAHVAVQPYVYGVTLGPLENQLEVGYGTLLGALHQMAERLSPACEQRVKEYRQASVRPADETGWRTDGRNG